MGFSTPALPSLDMAGDGTADMQTFCGLSSMVGLLSCVLRPLYAAGIPASTVKPAGRMVCCCWMGLLKGPASTVLKDNRCCMATEPQGAPERKLLSAMTAVLSAPGMCCR
jgi:hypothetical protein